ncbi:MAG TPA: gliding motility-associated C-terminal domain-containing protein, partial [Lacibacter sp.]|nr:gliding motility-associated C-terminal domain-containing protein [Lacibacter sp.]
DKTILVGSKATLEGVANLATATSIRWTPAATVVAGAGTLTPSVSPITNTVYTLTVVNNENCTSTDNVLVTVIPVCVDPMKAFTPNGDGINERWLVTKGTACVSRVSVTVFNRSGMTVYKNDNYQNDWDGTFNGKAVPDGTYYYKIRYNLINGAVAEKSGDVTIIR